jgi:hypothetical protein
VLSNDSCGKLRLCKASGVPLSSAGVLSTAAHGWPCGRPWQGRRIACVLRGYALIGFAVPFSGWRWHMCILFQTRSRTVVITKVGQVLGKSVGDDGWYAFCCNIS